LAQREEGRPDRTILGVGIILVSVLTMAFADAIVKLVSADLTVWQVFFARSLVAIPILVALSPATGTGLKPRAPIWVFVRSGLLLLTWLAFYASLPVLSLSVAAVAVYTNPIITALLSAALIGERVTGRPDNWRNAFDHSGWNARRRAVFEKDANRGNRCGVSEVLRRSVQVTAWS